MNDQKLENLLNLALDATDAEREKSLNMNLLNKIAILKVTISNVIHERSYSKAND